MALIPTPSQTVGPYLYLGLNWLRTETLEGDGVEGKRIALTGRLLDGNGQPVPDGVLEIWQADGAGNYGHPEDRRRRTSEAGFTGFGRIPTAPDGSFRFTTIKPGPVPGPGNRWQAPHILVAIFMRGILKQLWTRIYFADEAANAEDPVLALIPDPSRRETLIATRQGAAAEYRFDIHLQGERETVFFDL